MADNHDLQYSAIFRKKPRCKKSLYDSLRTETNAKKRMKYAVKLQSFVKPKQVDISQFVTADNYFRGFVEVPVYNQIVQYLHGLLQQGLVQSWDLFESEDPFIRACAFDAMTLEVEEALESVSRL